MGRRRRRRRNGAQMALDFSAPRSRRKKRKNRKKVWDRVNATRALVSPRDSWDVGDFIDGHRIRRIGKTFTPLAWHFKHARTRKIGPGTGAMWVYY